MASLSDIATTQSKLEIRLKNSRTLPLIDQLIQQLEQKREAVLSQNADTAFALSSLKSSVETFQRSVADEQKETYNVQAKHGKAIAKRFKLDLTAASEASVFEGKQNLINNAIALNLIRQGLFDLAESFAEEAQITLDANLVQQFRTMYSILTSLDQDDLSQAIAWASRYRTQLLERNSKLEFELHKTQFMRIFTSEHIFKAIEYAQTYFPPFSGRHLKEIQQLMAAFAFHDKITKSPYAHVFAAVKTDDGIKQSFVVEFTALLGMTPISPLLTTVEAASLALPTLIKLSSLKLTTTKSTTGVDLPLPPELRFHSVFVCPVTKEVGGDAWMLGCGHVIGGEAMHSLSKGTQKLKCPYCPVISDLREGLKLNL